MLRGNEYLGQYGKITKILIPSHTYHSHSTSPQYSAYVTFESELEAAFVIIGLFEFSLGENVIRSSYGSTKYCLFYLRNKSCLNKDCLYQHLQASPHFQQKRLQQPTLPNTPKNGQAHNHPESPKLPRLTLSLPKPTINLPITLVTQLFRKPR